MSQSTDAVLFWGYCWEDETSPYADESDDEADDRHARLSGLEGAEWKQRMEAREAAGVEVGHHCSDACRMPFVSVTASKTTAWRGSPKAIASLEVGADWREKLDAYCSLMGIKPPQDAPGWWLVSWWG